MAIKVPNVIKRPPKSLTMFSKWKCMMISTDSSLNVFMIFYSAIEYFSWLLYYSVPVLHDILDPKYFEHYCLLVSSLHILLSEVITENMLRLAQTCLQTFYEQYSGYYGKCQIIYMTHFL